MYKNIAGTCRKRAGNQKFQKKAKYAYYDVIMDIHQDANMCQRGLACYKLAYDV